MPCPEQEITHLLWDILALLNKTDSTLVSAFQQLPIAERQTVTVTQLTAVTQTVQASEQIGL